MTTQNPIQNQTTALDSLTEADYREAFAAIRPEIDAITDAELVTVTLDPQRAAGVVRGSLKRMKKLRDRIASLEGYGASTLDHLENVALAVYHAQTLYLAATEPAAPIQAMAEELTGMRERFVGDFSALAKHKLVDGAKLKDLKGPIGFANLARDVQFLVTMMRASWSSIAGKVATTEADLDRADKLSLRLSQSADERQYGEEAATEATKVRQRAFTHLVKTYDEVRRAVVYLRWAEGDADEIAPTIYVSRAAPKKSSPEETPEPAPSPVAPAPVAFSPLATTAPVPGMPEDSPFGNA